jgi:hypothetical protein
MENIVIFALLSVNLHQHFEVLSLHQFLLIHWYTQVREQILGEACLRLITKNVHDLRAKF